jgi:F0F1-type ATP synthase epsilon subunit
MSYKLTILSSTGVIAKTTTTSTYLPTTSGEVGILDNHRAYCTVLAPGTLRYTAEGGSDAAPKTVEIKGGFAEFSRGELVVLAG